MNKFVWRVSLTPEYMETVRGWRNNMPETTRTSYMLTAEMQQDYYQKEICNRDSKTRYWAFIDPSDNILIGYGGIEHIETENRTGEISVIVNPQRRKLGYGDAIVHEILKEAFNGLNLYTVWGECYASGATKFWEKQIAKYKAYKTILPARKYWNGKYWPSLYFTFTKGCL